MLFDFVVGYGNGDWLVVWLFVGCVCCVFVWDGVVCDV